MTDQNDRKNVIDLKAARKIKKAKAKQQKQGAQGRTSNNNGKPTWGHYIQFFLFLILLAYFMKTCSG